MSVSHNKPFIEKCIVSFSHNKVASRALANRMSIEKAEREMASGKKGISHLILRAEDDEIDQLKFLFLLHGIPIMCYALENLLHSSLREIVVIGSGEVGRVLEKFLETVGDHGRKICFVREDESNLSLFNTLALGRSKLNLEPDELILFQPGDLPFLYDLEKVIHDGDIEQHNLILWLNSRQKMFPRAEQEPDSEFVQRNYHYRGIFESVNELHDIKEPNVYPINLTAVNLDLINHLHSSRKDGKILNAGLKFALNPPSRVFRLIPVILYHALHFRSDLKRFRANDQYQFGMHERNFKRGASLLLDTSFTVKLHNDPAFVSDVDALEDWEDFESLLDFAFQKHGEEGLTQIYPYGDDLLRFKELAMPKLREELPIYRNFPEYINRIYRTLQMDHVPFDANGKYLASNAHPGKLEYAWQWYRKKAAEIKSQKGNHPSERCATRQDGGFS